MPSKELDVSYIVLNWKLPEKTLVAVKSIRDQSEGTYEVIIVDNESRPEGVEELRHACDQLLVNKTNLGFAAACNQAARVARGRYLAFINQDAVLPANWTKHGLRVLDTKAGAASTSGGEKLNKNQAYSTARVSPWTGLVYQSNGKVSEITQVPYGFGSNLLVSAKKFWAVEGFEASYFAYYEDLDLGAKLMSKGWTNWYVPEMTIDHEPGSSTGSGKSTFRNRLIQRNKYRFIARQYNYWIAVVLLAATHDVISFVVKSLVVLLKSQTKDARSARLSVYSAQLVSAAWALAHLRLLAASRRQNKYYYWPDLRTFLRQLPSD